MVDVEDFCPNCAAGVEAVEALWMAQGSEFEEEGWGVEGEGDGEGEGEGGGGEEDVQKM